LERLICRNWPGWAGTEAFYGERHQSSMQAFFHLPLA
jgi:hypothetical protein